MIIEQFASGARKEDEGWADVLHQTQELHHAEIALLFVCSLHGADIGRVKDEKAAWVGGVLR